MCNGNCLENHYNDDCCKQCSQYITTDCIYYDENGTGVNSKKLLNIGVTSGSYLSSILRKIDDKLGTLLSSSFESYEMNGFNTDGAVKNIKDFVDVITAAVRANVNSIAELQELIEGLDEDYTTLEESIEDNNKPELSNAEFNINNTDTVAVVLSKIIDALVDLKSEELQYLDTSSVTLVETDNSLSADVNISETFGNIISIKDDGLYAQHPSISGWLDSIKTQPELLALFTGLVNTSFPAFTFDLISTETLIINYINILGNSVNVTVNANVLKTITDVKRVVTPPSTTLRITFKGIS